MGVHGSKKNMPIFNVRVDAGDGPDELGDPIDFPHDKAAREDAQKALAEMARDRMPLDRDTHFGVEIADEAGRRIYKASLDLSQQTDPSDLASTTPDIAMQLGSGPRD